MCILTCNLIFFIWFKRCLKVKPQSLPLPLFYEIKDEMGLLHWYNIVVKSCLYFAKSLLIFPTSINWQTKSNFKQTKVKIFLLLFCQQRWHILWSSTRQLIITKRMWGKRPKSLPVPESVGADKSQEAVPSL